MSTRLVSLDLRTTALIVLDLQIGVVGLPLAPYPGAEVVSRCAQLAERFRTAGQTVILVHLGFNADGRDRLAPAVDSPLVHRQRPLPNDWDPFVPEMQPHEGDLVIT